MILRHPWRLLRRKPAPWVADLDRRQRRTLAANLRRLMQSKAELERAVSKSARPR
ncbi:MAG: hypothetical protein ACYTEZ_04205 [Planctomycetota bacterium]|jgi:hypothetical protein